MPAQKRPLSVSVIPLETRLNILQYVAVRADELGYDGFGLPETWSYDTAVLLTALFFWLWLWRRRRRHSAVNRRNTTEVER